MDSEILVPDDESDFPLMSLASHLSAKPAERGEVAAVLNIERRRIAMNDNRFISHKSATPFVIAPYTLRLRIGGRAAENATKHLESRVDPVLLVDRSCSVPLDARNEQDHQNAFTAGPQNPPALP